MTTIEAHRIEERKTAAARGNINSRVFGCWHQMRYNDLSSQRMRDARDLLLDHAGALLSQDAGLDGDGAQSVLQTAAQCALGELDLGPFAGGDWRVEFTLIDEVLSSDDFSPRDPERGPESIEIWLDAFALCLIASGLHEPWRIGPVLLDDYAPDLRDVGAPASSVAELDALCGYLLDGDTCDSPDAPVLRKPDTAKSTEFIRRLTDSGELTPDQRLLRVLLADDQPAFENALVERLELHREQAGQDPEPRSLLPVRTIALANLASSAHGWDLGVQSTYLPLMPMLAGRGRVG